MRIRIFRNSLPLLAAALGLLSAAGGAAVVESRWADEPPRIDGRTSEWGQVVMSSQKNLGIDLAFRNDANNLYVLVVFKDRRYLSSMEFTGLTLYFSPTVKKQKDFGVRFLRKNAPAEVGFEWGGMTKEIRAALMGRGEMPDQSEVSGEDARGERAEDEGAGASPSLARLAQGPRQYSFWVDLRLAQAPTQ